MTRINSLHKIVAIALIVPLLVLFAVDLSALLKGQPDASKAQATSIKVTTYRGKVVYTKDKDGNITGFSCQPSGWSCFITIIETPAAKYAITVRFPW